MGAIYRREIRAFLVTPFGWVFLGFFLLLAGIFFSLTILVNRSSSYNSFLDSILFVYLFIIPMLTMRLIAEESRQKTDQLLFSSPVSTVAIILGKYLAALTLFLSACAVMFSWVVIIAVRGDLQTAATLGGCTGFVLTGAAFIALGTFVSSVTESQGIAAVLTFALLLGFWLVDTAGALGAKLTGIPGIATTFSWFSVLKRQESFNLGLVRLDSIVFFFTLIFMFLFSGVRVLEKRREG